MEPLILKLLFAAGATKVAFRKTPGFRRRVRRSNAILGGAEGRES